MLTSEKTKKGGRSSLIRGVSREIWKELRGRPEKGNPGEMQRPGISL